MSTLADRLREALSDTSGATQADLARACGVRAPSVNDWFSGKTKSLRGATLIKAADFLSVHPLWLAEGKGVKRLRNATKETAEDVPTSGRSDWPFRRLPLSRVHQLTPNQLLAIEDSMIRQVDAFLDRSDSSGTRKQKAQTARAPFDPDKVEDAFPMHIEGMEMPRERPLYQPSATSLSTSPRPTAEDPFADDAENDEFIDVREFDVRMAAGDAIPNDDMPPIGQIPISRNQLRQRGIDPDKVYIVRARGDSMSPTIPDGALMLFVAEPPQSWHEIRSERIYGIRQNGGLAVKRIARSKLTGSWVAKSDNHKTYPDFHLQDDEQVKVLGWVAWVQGPAQADEGRWL